MSVIKCIDGDVYISKELLDKSERLKGPNGLSPGITKKKMISILEAANLDPLLRVPLPEDIPVELLYSFFPHTIPPDPLPDPDAVTKELYRKMKEVRRIIKSFNGDSWFSCCFVTKKQIETRAIVREKFLEEISKVPGGTGLEKMFRKFDRFNQATLLRFEETHGIISKLYDDFLATTPLQNQPPNGTTLKQL